MALALPTPALAATIAVNCGSSSIQAAIDGAAAGDIVLVSGTCNENVLVRNEKQRITIDGAGAGVGTRATVNGGSTSPTFNLRGKGILVQNFTITGGSNGVWANRGANAVLNNNIIQVSAGNGVMVDEFGIAILTSNVIQNHPGAGVVVSEMSTARIGFNADSETAASANTIQLNSAGGIIISNRSSARIVGNNIVNNIGDGIQVARDSHADIASNTINANSGDGIQVAENSLVQLGEDSGTSIFETANSGLNSGVGIRCLSGGFADGRRGFLTGSGGASNFAAGCINALPTNEAPVVNAATFALAENSANGTNVGTVSFSDPDSGQTATFSITAGNIGNAFTINPTSGQITVISSAALNFETTPSFSLTVQVTDNGTPQLSGSATITVNLTDVNDAPVAVNKNYSAQTNMKIAIAAGSGLLVGATDPDAGTTIFSVGTVSATSPAGGNVTFTASTGAFDFDPPPGVTGNVTFTYTVCDNGAPQLCSAAATVTVNVAGPVIWFVNNAVAGPGDGRLSSPFKTLASADAVDAANHNIFLYTGSYSTGITLNSGETLIGQGVTGASFDALFGLAPPTGTIARPSVNGTRPTLGGTVSLNTNSAVRGLNIVPPNNIAGLSASGVAGVSTNEVSVTTTGTVIAVNLVNTPDGVFSFTAISSSGAANGIIWNNSTPATGSFTVTGNGGTCTNANTSGCSGGTIANTTGADNSTATPTGTGIVLNNANNVSLTRMLIHDHSNYGIRGTNVTGFTLSNAVVNGTNGSNTASPFNDSSVRFENLTGSASVTSTHIQGGFADNFRVSNNTAANLDRLTFTSVTIGTNSNPGGNDGISVESLPTSTGALKMTVTNSAFTAAAGDLLQYSHNGTGVGDLVITNSQFSNNHPTIATGGGGVSLFADGNTTMTITGNTFRDSLGHAILIAKTQPDATTLGVTFSNNSVGVTGLVNSGSKEGSAVKLQTLGGGAFNAAVRNNTILGYNNFGIELLAGGGASATGGNLHATITGNNVAEPGNNVGTEAISKNGIHLNIGTTPGDSFAACAKLGGDGTPGNEKNTISASGKDGIPATGLGDIDFRLRQRQSTTIRLPGYAGSNNDNTAVVSFVQANNNTGGTPAGLASNTVATGGGFVGGAACTLP